VQKLPWGNTVEVTEGIEEALDELRPGLERAFALWASSPGMRTARSEGS